MQLAMSFATDQTAQLINTLWEYCQCLNLSDDQTIEGARHRLGKRRYCHTRLSVLDFFPNRCSHHEIPLLAQ